MTKPKFSNSPAPYFLLFFIVLAFRTTGVIDWAWWWVAAPLWGGMLIDFCRASLMVGAMWEKDHLPKASKVNRTSKPDYDRLNPPIVDHILCDDGWTYQQLIDDEQWLHVGYIPTPTTKLGWLTYHIIHGLAMRYPLMSVIRYSFREAFFKEEGE